MKHIYAHPSDEELLSSIDGELSQRSSLRIQRHLEECWDCRSRLKAMEQTIADFVEVHHESLDCHLPPAEGPRALLRARMSEDARNSRRSWVHLLSPRIETTPAAYAALSLLVLIALLATGYRWISSRNPGHQMSAAAYLIPDKSLTPGSVRPIGVNNVCSTTYSDDADQVPASVRRKVFNEYHVNPQQSTAYALDYLVSPQLGGTADIRNLWPEPAAQTVWNVRAKDALEDHLHELVCEGRVDLGTAQHDLATNWVSAYQKYFHTSTPVNPL
jgi:hypothetical protein